MAHAAVIEDLTVYPVAERVGEDILQRWIVKLVRQANGALQRVDRSDGDRVYSEVEELRRRLAELEAKQRS